MLIQAAIALLGLTAFSAFVIDYGIMWTSRSQAQASADAGALAAASALAWDSGTDFAGATAKAVAIAKANMVWGEAPDVLTTDVTYLSSAVCKPPAYPGIPDTCVKVDVYRNQARNNPLPTIFASLMGIQEQGVRATATAQIAGAGSTECLRPWAVLDRWDEYKIGSDDIAPGGHNYPSPDPDFNSASTYDTYSDGKGQAPPKEPDLYVPPSTSSPGTGFRLPDDVGKVFAVKVGDGGSTDIISPGWFRGIQIPNADGCLTGADCYRENIQSCAFRTSSINVGGFCPTTIPGIDPADGLTHDAEYWAEHGCFGVETGNMVGPTSQGVDNIVGRDSGAHWVGADDSTGSIVGSQFDPPTSSPRVVPIGVLDIDAYLSANPTGSGGVIRLVNIFGFFVDGMGDMNPDGTWSLSPGGKDVIGHIMTYPGDGPTKLTSISTFLNQVVLVR